MLKGFLSLAHKSFLKTWIHNPCFCNFRVMKNLVYLILISVFVFACGSTQERDMAKDSQTNDTVRIANAVWILSWLSLTLGSTLGWKRNRPSNPIIWAIWNLKTGITWCNTTSAQEIPPDMESSTPSPSTTSAMWIMDWNSTICSTITSSFFKKNTIKNFDNSEFRIRNWKFGIKGIFAVWKS